MNITEIARHLQLLIVNFNLSLTDAIANLVQNNPSLDSGQLVAAVALAEKSQVVAN